MSYPETPAPTEAQQILAAVEALGPKLDKLTTALNSVGENQQWMIDQAKGIFQMFSSPQFMNQILSGVASGGRTESGAVAEPVESD